MLREAHLQMEINHPNMLGMEAVVVGDGCIIFVLELMSFSMREDLSDKKKQYMEESKMKDVLRKLLSGLSYIHSKSIIHRDIKPDNIFVSNKSVKIGDFGSARNFWSDGSLPYSDDVVTVEYRAPEVLLGSNSYSEAIDVWATGCLFAEMWAGTANSVFGRPDAFQRNSSEEESLPFGSYDSNSVGSQKSSAEEDVKSTSSQQRLSDEDVEPIVSEPITSEEVLQNIFRALGVPSTVDWPGLDGSCVEKFKATEVPPLGMDHFFPTLDLNPQGKDLLLKLVSQPTGEDQCRSCSEASFPHLINDRINVCTLLDTSFLYLL